MEFKNVEQIIRPLLSNHMELRADDMALYRAYLKSQGVFNVSSFVEMLTNHEKRIKSGFASYDAVSRARRKLQEKYPDLRPSKRYLEGKKAAEAEYRKYARERGR